MDSSIRQLSPFCTNRGSGLTLVAVAFLVLLPVRSSFAQDWWRPYRPTEEDGEARPEYGTAGRTSIQAQTERSGGARQETEDDEFLNTVSRTNEAGPFFTAQNTQPPAPNGEPPSSESQDQDDDSSDTEEEPRVIGQAPEDVRQYFLRRATPLLRPGQLAFDFGFEYVWQEFTGPTVLPGGFVAEARVRSRQIVAPTAIRYGYSDRMQLFLNMPFGLAHQEFANPIRDEITRVFGPGDLTAGFNYLLRQEDADAPSLIGTLSFTAPVAADPFEASPGTAALGNGFWAISGSLLAVKSYDPVVVFGGVGYRHQFDRDFLGFEVDPGEAVSYNFGVGFAANDYLTFSTAFLGAYQSNFKLDDVSISDSSQEPFSIRLALTHTKSKCLIVEPFIRFGLNDDAAEADFGIIWTRRY